MRKFPHLLLLLTLVTTACFVHAQAAPAYDVLIRNGRVVDGSGNPWVYADVGINGDRIVFIGRADAAITAKQVIDAKGMIVAPGFIDMLGHSEDSLLVDKQAVSKLTQGITTEITGEGSSIAPMNAKIIAKSKEWYDHYKIAIDWRSLDEYLMRLEKQGSGINLGSFVGATQVRMMALDEADRAPTAEDLAAMKEMVDDAMLDGAFGLSTSLIYAPAFYAKTEELIELAKVAQKHGGIYATHIRNEGDKQMEALDEAFRIGREANIPVEIWHLKVSGQQNWGRMRQVIDKIEAAREQGLDVTADQYPYIASATSLGASIPPKYHEGGTAAFIARLKDPETRALIRAELEPKEGGHSFENMWRGVGGPQGVLVTSVLSAELKPYEGKTIAQIADLLKKDPMDTLMDLLIAGNANIGAVYFSMKEEDVRLAMQQPWVSFDTDYGAVNPTGPLGESKSHPRAYGTFPRILGKYVREEKVLRLEEAIRKMTSMPAQRVKLENRGMIRPDFYADITIFDPETVIDVATFEDPNRVSKGIEYVLVNGAVALEKGKLTGRLAGRPLRGPGYNNRGVAPEGLRPKAMLLGTLTSQDGWPLPRATVTLLDAQGRVLATVGSKRDGRYELTYPQACKQCFLKAERPGFKSKQQAIDFNGSNNLSFSFSLEVEGRKKRTKE